MPTAENNKKINNPLVSLWGKSTGTNLCRSAVGCIWKRAGFWGAVSCRAVRAWSLHGRCWNPSAVLTRVHTKLVRVIRAGAACLSSRGERGVHECFSVLFRAWWEANVLAAGGSGARPAADLRGGSSQMQPCPWEDEQNGPRCHSSAEVLLPAGSDGPLRTSVLAVHEKQSP